MHSLPMEIACRTYGNCTQNIWKFCRFTLFPYNHFQRKNRKHWVLSKIENTHSETESLALLDM